MEHEYTIIEMRVCHQVMTEPRGIEPWQIIAILPILLRNVYYVEHTFSKGRTNNLQFETQ